jgi:hypothetical protein
MVAAGNHDWGRGMKKSVAIFAIFAAVRVYGQGSGIYYPAFSHRDVEKWGLVTGQSLIETNLNSLLMVQTNVFAEMFETAWNSAGDGTYTNETGWRAFNAYTAVPGQVTLSASGSYIQTPKTAKGYADLSLDSTVTSGGVVSYASSTDGTNWTNAISTGNNVFLRIAYAGGMPSFGAAPSVTINSAAVYGFVRPEWHGLTNSFIGRRILIDPATQDNNPVSKYQLDRAILAASGDRWAEHRANAEPNLGGLRMVLSTNYFIGAENDLALSLGWNRQDIVKITGGNAGFVVPVISVRGVTASNITLTVTGANGWKPLPYYSTNLLSGAWAAVSTNNFSSTYPALVDGTYSLSISNMNTATAFFKVIATNDTGCAVAENKVQIKATIYYEGVPTSTNGLAPFAVWCDTNQQNTLKVILP